MSTSKTVVVFGATDGLGREIARRYTERGNHVIAVGRRSPDELSSANLVVPNSYVQCDLTDLRGLSFACEEIRSASRAPIDLLILNAATGWYGDFFQQAEESVRQLIDVNLVSPIMIVHQLLPSMRRPDGQIVFVGSVAEAMPCPRYAVYAATKCGLAAFSRALRIELNGQIDVQIVHPGPIATGFHQKCGLPQKMIDRSSRFPSVSTVAAQMLRAIERGKGSAALGAGNRMAHFVFQRFPRALDAIVRARRNWKSRSSVHEANSARLRIEVAGEQKSKRVLVTGGAQGIGLAICQRFHRESFEVIAIDQKQIDPAIVASSSSGGKQCTVRLIQADLALTADLDRIVEEVKTTGPVDCVILNAGINRAGSFARRPITDCEWILNVNFVSAIELLRRLVSSECLSQNASVVFVSSLSHFLGYPGAAVYAASKSAIASFARSISVQAGSGLRVLTVFPGPTRTEQARDCSPDNSREGKRMSPEYLADRIFQSVKAKRRKLIPGIANIAAAQIGRWAPALADRLMNRVILQPLVRQELAGER